MGCLICIALYPALNLFLFTSINLHLIATTSKDFKRQENLNFEHVLAFNI